MQYIGWAGANNGTVPAIPAHNSGDLVIGYISGKANTADGTVGDGTMSGFTRLAPTHYGGTGTHATDLGVVYLQVFAKIGDGTTTAPTIGGLANSISGVIGFHVLRADSGYVLRDAIGSALEACVVDGSDTTSTTDNLLTATTSAWASGSAPNGSNADAIVVMTAMPADTGSALGTVSHSATGLSGGTETGRGYHDSTASEDCGASASSWLGFSGTPSTGLTVSHTITSYTNPTGAIVAVAVRQTLNNVNGSASLAATDTLTATGAVGAVATASLSATSTHTAAGVVGAVGAAALAVTATLTATGVVGTASDATLSANATLTATGTVTAANEGSAALDATADLDAEGVVGTFGDADLAATTTLTATGATGVSGDAALTAAATLTATGVPGVQSGATATWTATLTAAGQVDEMGSSGAVLAATADLTATGLVVSYDTDTSNHDDGLDYEGAAEVLTDPPVVPPPAGVLAEARTVAVVVDTAPGAYPNFTPAVARTEAIPGLRERWVVGGKDVTFLDDVPVQVSTVRLIDPLLYGSATMTFHQLNPAFIPELGTGALSWLCEYAPVVGQLVDADGEIVDAAYYRGFVSRWDLSGTAVTVELLGQASGALSALPVPEPVYRRKQDIEHILVDTIRDAHCRAKKSETASGVSVIRRGGAKGLDIFNEMLGVWAGSTGLPITYMPDADGRYTKTLRATTGVDFTVYPEEGLVSQSIGRDLMTENNRVYVRGRTFRQELVSNVKVPGGQQIDPPSFPNVDESPMTEGDTDADTDSGAGVTQVQEQLALHNFYDIEDGTPGVYGSAVTRGVRQVQKFAGLNVTGEVGPNTWDMLWNLTELGYSLDGAREYPMAEDPRVREWNRTANGSKASRNPLYDPQRAIVGEFVDVDGPFSRRRIDEFADSRLAPEGGVWVGTVTLRSGVVDGEHNPGDPFTTALVRDRRTIKPNMRAWFPWFQGGKVFYVTGIEHGPEESVASVSTLPETTYETWSAIQRAREARTSIARLAQGHIRASQVRMDTARQWDTSSGRPAGARDLAAGWNEVEIFAGQSGVVQRIRMVLDSPAEFAVILSPKPLSLDRLAGIDPLADPGGGSEWYEVEATADWFDSRDVLYTWGTFAQPCGYDPGKKSSGADLSGVFQEVAGMNYETGARPVLYLYPYVTAPNVLRGGRILRSQRTTDY